MTTYDGKGYKYDSKGKEVVNREPPVSKHIVEKLYRIHRTNVINCEPLTDCHVVIPEFLTNTAWKKLGEQKKKKDQLIQNEKIFQRISKVENNRSRIVKEIEEHVKRVEDVKGKMQKLSEQGRLKHLLKIQRDNAVILERIEKARPSITAESIAEWYKPHTLYKDGRRSDVTAGHIMHNMKGLLPSKLPPLEPSLAGSQSMRSISSKSVLERTKGGGSSASVYSSIGMDSVTSLPMSMSDADRGYGYLSSLRNSISPTGFEDYYTAKTNVSPKSSGMKSPPKGKSDRFGNDLRTKSGGGVSNSLPVRSTVGPSNTSSGSPLARPHSASEANHGPFIDHLNDNASNESSQELDSSIASNDTDSDMENESNSIEMEKENELVILVSRPFPLPYDSKNCQVNICCLSEPDDMLHIRVFMAGDPNQFLGERILHKNKALEIINATNNLAQQAAINDDLQALRSVLINMFKEADDDGNGFLTFDEFQVLLEKVDLGISSQEMRFVISEADENENGVVDYCEFVPLAVDMIQSFRARNRAKTQTSQEDSEIDEVIMQSLSQSEIDHITETCMAKIKEVDTKNYGVLKPNELRRCLNSVSQIFVNDKEITMICQSLPRDPFNRCIYSGLREVVAKIRFMTLKNNYVEARGTELHKYLLDRCREEEHAIRQKRGSADDVETGRLPFRAMTNLLQSSSRLSLSRLQVMVIMAEASAVEGMVDYYQFCPVVAKTIEIMFEPKTLRQRAELIEKTDLSPEALLSGLSAEEFKYKLATLFKSYDIDHSGALDKDELKSCLQALDFHLTDGEIAALRVAADLRTSGALSMDDFFNFFTQNLLQLEREKHIQILQKSLHNKTQSQAKRQQQLQARAGLERLQKQDIVTVEQYAAHLETFFKLADNNGSGFLDRAEFESLLMTLDINISPFQLDCIMTEMDLSNDNKIQYKEFIPIAADLLAAFKAKEKAQTERETNEDWALAKAQRIMKSSMHDINHIVRYIKERVCLIEETIEDPLTRMTTIQEVIRNPHSGLSRTEANSIIMKLFTLEAITNRSRYSFRKHVTKAAGRANATHLNGIGTSSNSHMGTGRKGALPKDHPSLVNATDEVSKHENTGESVLTTHDLRAAVIEARERSIMRSLLEDVDPDSLEVTICSQCEAVFEKMIADGIIPASSVEYLPLNVLFTILERIPNLRLNRAQLMAVTSWIPREFYDASSTNVDFRQFATYAAGVVAKMRKPDSLDNRAAILDDVDLSDEALLCGLTEKALHDYFVEEFSSKNSEEKISEENFINIIISIPNLKLHRQDAITVLSSFPRSSDGCITWREFLPWSHNTILHLLREKAIEAIMRKRAEDEKRKADAEAKRSEFKDLAEKLIEYVKIKQQNDIIHVYLPGDNNQRRSLVMKTNVANPTALTGRPATNRDGPNATVQLEEEENGFAFGSSEAQIFKAARILPSRLALPDMFAMSSPTIAKFKGISQKSNQMRVASPNRVSSPNAVPGAPKVKVELPKFPVLIRIVTVNNASSNISHEKDIVAKVYSLDGSFIENVPIPVRMSSLAYCDTSAAETFAQNLVDKMYMEIRDATLSNGTSKPKLMIEGCDGRV